MNQRNKSIDVRHLRKDSYYNYITLGYDCSTSSALKNMGLRMY